MRILYLIDSLRGGGAEKLLSDIIQLFADRKNVDVLLLTDEDAKYAEILEKKRIRLFVKPESSKNHLSIVRYISGIINRGNYDIVHANLFPITYYCSIIHFLSKKKLPKYVMTEHSTDNRRRHIKGYWILERWIYSNYDAVVSISAGTEDKLISWLHKKNHDQRFVVIENGIPLNEYITATKYEKSDIFCGICDNDYLLCMVGSIKPLKNQRLMVEIINNLPERYKLILVGDGPQKEEIIEYISMLGLEKRIKLLGFRADVANVMKSSHLVVIPSKWEGFGLVAVEAMACGIPIVSSDVPGLADIVGEAGIKANKLEEYVNAILSFEDEEKYKIFSQQAKKRASQFDIKHTKEKYEALYSSLLG